MQSREIRQIITARQATDGAGVKIMRLTGYAESLKMDPFLMLDEIRSGDKDDFIGGFPPHPHRGFETITYMREGHFSHSDSMGNSGSITSGGAQWMKAGSGVIHSEMPAAGADRMHGFQFWLNLPAAEKMQPPEYRDIQGDEVVVASNENASVRVIAGTLELDGQAIEGVVTGKSTRPLFVDVEMQAGNSTTISMEAALNVQFFVYSGSVSVGGKTVERGQMAYLTDGDAVELLANENSGILLFGGVPIGEPVAHYGPYVMNTQEELEEAVYDYQQGTLVRDVVAS